MSQLLPKQSPPVIRLNTPRTASSFDRKFDDVRLVFDMNRVSGPAIRYEPVERRER